MSACRITAVVLAAICRAFMSCTLFIARSSHYTLRVCRFALNHCYLSSICLCMLLILTRVDHITNKKGYFLISSFFTFIWKLCSFILLHKVCKCKLCLPVGSLFQSISLCLHLSVWLWIKSSKFIFACHFENSSNQSILVTKRRMIQSQLYISQWQGVCVPLLLLCQLVSLDSSFFHMLPFK